MMFRETNILDNVWWLLNGTAVSTEWICFLNQFILKCKDTVLLSLLLLLQEETGPVQAPQMEEQENSVVFLLGK